MASLSTNDTSITLDVENLSVVEASPMSTPGTSAPNTPITDNEKGSGTKTTSPSTPSTPSSPSLGSVSSSSPERLERKFRRKSTVSEISQMSPEKLASYMQRYEKLTVDETFKQKYQIFYQRSKRVGCTFEKEDWMMFQKSHYAACLQTRMSPVGIFMYKEECSKYSSATFQAKLNDLKAKIPKDVTIPEDTHKWLNEVHDWDDKDNGGWSFFACCSGDRN